MLDSLGLKRRTPKEVHNYLERTDLGKFLVRSSDTPYEARGRPATDAQAGLAALSESYGYDRARDKPLNKAMLDALLPFVGSRALEAAGLAEHRLDFAELTPDVQIEMDGHLYCLEFVWRRGDYLGSSNRSHAAQYILDKVKNYALGLDWLEA